MTVDRSYAGDQFPAGMRVLAVDDHPPCLKILDALLRKCRYHVTTTSQSREALKLLRENPDKFDLVISDVHMPDMDGFKLLELVGLEMDLPVIMLSANGDTNFVMKGITHGACDYLLKPVRMEELKNIWQHVVRKKTMVNPKGKNNFDNHYNENGVQVVTKDSDQNCKLNKKRKDQKENDDGDRENGPRNEDSSTQKKARLVWTGELHRKFVAAVRTLGVEKAYPKKILDVMNVEKLTRENVASHLQKYKKYLDRISSVARQQANMVATVGGPDAAYLHMTSRSGYRDLRNHAVNPFSSNGLLGLQLNTPAGLPIHALPSSGTNQLGHAPNLNNPNDMQPKFQPVIIPGNQNENLLQGMPSSLKYDQLQLGTYDGNHSDPPSNPTAKLSVFPIPGNGNQSWGTLPLSNMEFPFDLPDFGRCTDNWSACQPNPFTSSNVLKATIPRDSGNNMFPTFVNSCTIPSLCGTSDLRADFVQKLRSEEINFSAYQNSNHVCNSMVSSYGVLDSLTKYNDNFDKSSGFNRNDLDVVEIQSLADRQITQQTEVDQSAPQAAVKIKQGYTMDQTNPLGGYSYNNGDGSLEDLVSSMMKLDPNMFRKAEAMQRKLF